jgi:hypothetical protein
VPALPPKLTSPLLLAQSGRRVVDAGLADRTVSVGIMRPEDFFRDEPDAFGFGTVRKVDRDLLESLRRGPADVAQDSVRRRLPVGGVRSPGESRSGGPFHPGGRG